MTVFFTIGNADSVNEEDKIRKKIVATIEVVALVFLATFIPSLIRLGRPPSSIEEIWVELLVAIMASLYAYARIRGIDLQPKPPED